MDNIIIDLNVLSNPAKPLEFITEQGTDRTEGDEIIARLKAVMDVNSDVLALSAPQIGIDARVICIRFNDGIKTFIDPIITKKADFKVTVETFSSMPGKEIVIARPTEVQLKYYNEDFKYEDNKLLGKAAALLDQQVNLLDGIVPSALGMVSDVVEDGHVTENDLPLVAEFYHETFLPARLKQAQEAIKAAAAEDESVEKDYKQLKFMEDVINGRTLVVDSPEETESKRLLQREVAIKQNKQKEAIAKSNFRSLAAYASKKRTKKGK